MNPQELLSGEIFYDMPDTNIFNQSNAQDVDPAALAPILAHSSIRRLDIYKLPPKINSFGGSSGKNSTTLDLYPSLHTIHTCKNFRLPYTQAVETESSLITDIVMSYGMVGDCEKFDVEHEDQDNSAQEAISRLTLTNAEDTEEQAAAIRLAKLEELAAN